MDYKEEKIKIIKEGKLGERPSWDEYFMKLAISTSSRSSCFNVHSGSVIVLDNRIVGTGYNGAPPGMKSCLERGKCFKEQITGQLYKDNIGKGNCIGTHSEMNALANLNKSIHKGATIYTTIFPCPHCAKMILAYGIKKIVFKKKYDEKEMEMSIMMFNEAKVQLFQMDISKERIIDIDINLRGAVFNLW